MNTKIRRTLVKLALPLAVAGIAALASSAQASAATVPIGLYAGPGNVSSLTSFASWLGAPVDYATDYVPYTNGWSTDFNPQWLVGPWGRWVKASPNRRLVLGVPLLENGYAGQFSQEAAGAFDSYFTGLGEQLVSHGLANTIIRLGYEANNPGIGPWQATDDPAGFIAAYRHIVGVLRAVPGQHFLFDWNPTAGLTPNLPLNSFASFYPGDDVVDIIGLDVYDIDWFKPSATPQQRWNDILTETMGLEAQQTFAASHGKPVSFPEWGLYPDQNSEWAGGGDDPYFVNQMAAWINSSDTAYESYYNMPWGTGGTLASYPLSAAAYRLDFGPTSVLTSPAPAPASTGATSGLGSGAPTAASSGTQPSSSTTPTSTTTAPTSTKPTSGTTTGKSGGSQTPKHRLVLGELSAGVLTAAIDDVFNAVKVSRRECVAGSKHRSRAQRRRCAAGPDGALADSKPA